MWVRSLFILLVPVLLSGTGQSNAFMESAQVQRYMQRLIHEFGYKLDEPAVFVSVQQQRLYTVQQGKVQHVYAISTSSKGVGSQRGSDKTPAGIHRVTKKFGDGAEPGIIFKGRVNTGRKAEIIKEPISVNTDDVTTRILWLDGLEPGLNKGGDVDSKSRYIYIHGTPEEGLIGKPASHGCIRMHNNDVIELYNAIDVGCFVVIVDDTKA